jgi:hypothetical protein
MTAVALDLEFDGDTILCAATCWTNGLLQVPQLWVSHSAQGFAPLTKGVISSLVDALWNFHQNQVTIVTWGGTGCDWPRLAKSASAEDADRIRTLALNSVDIPLISAAANGMMMGLSATAAGMGLGMRPHCTSEDVPMLWKTKDAAKQNEVVQHVQWDAWVTVQIWTRLMFQIAYARPQICWITQRSGLRSVRLHREMAADGSAWVLPSVDSIMKWNAPHAKFQIPEHLHPLRLTQWLRT